MHNLSIWLFGGLSNKKFEEKVYNEDVAQIEVQIVYNKLLGSGNSPGVRRRTTSA
jgi:3-hydroxymyristoyl/3-hydroxydecanoyl-(acyl carrier protein) dehydratase